MYEVTGAAKGCQDLHRVIDTHKDYIQTTTKGPLVPHTGNSEGRKLIGEDKQKVRAYAKLLHASNSKLMLLFFFIVR